MEQIVDVAQLYFMPHPLLEIVQTYGAPCIPSYFQQVQLISVSV